MFFKLTTNNIHDGSFSDHSNHGLVRDHFRTMLAVIGYASASSVFACMLGSELWLVLYRVTIRK